MLRATSEPERPHDSNVRDHPDTKPETERDCGDYEPPSLEKLGTLAELTQFGPTTVDELDGDGTNP